MTNIKLRGSNLPDEFISFRELGEICFINGQEGLHETEHRFFRYLASKNEYPFVLDDLFNNPSKVKALKILNPDTIVIGTTGTYREKIEKVFAAFKRLNWLPKNAVFTMGEDYFIDFIEAGVTPYKIYPMMLGIDEPLIKKL